MFKYIYYQRHICLTYNALYCNCCWHNNITTLCSSTKSMIINIPVILCLYPSVLYVKQLISSTCISLCWRKNSPQGYKTKHSNYILYFTEKGSASFNYYSWERWNIVNAGTREHFWWMCRHFVSMTIKVWFWEMCPYIFIYFLHCFCGGNYLSE